jgi:hypothetical protein
VSTLSDRGCADASGTQVEFFGFELRVHSAKLAALLNTDEDGVQVRDATADEAALEAPGTGEAEQEWPSLPERVAAQAGSVVIQLRRPAGV